MATLEETAREFLSQQRLAVAGVSRKDGVANGIYRKLRKAGYTVFAINPNAAEVEGDPAYPNAAAIEGGVDGVIIATAADRVRAIVEECAAAGVPRVWIHGAFAGRNVPGGAVEAARAHGLTCIPGSCPMLFIEPADPAHRCLGWFRRVTGTQPVIE